MHLKTTLIGSYLDTYQMTKDNQTRKKQGEQALLSSLAHEVDSIFFSLRKADQVIRRELSLLNQKTSNSFKNHP